VRSNEQILGDSLREAGLTAFGFLSAASLREACSGLDRASFDRCGIGESGGAAAAALAYGEGPAGLPPWAAGYPGPLARIGRFARANWYAELGHRLELAAASARAAVVAAQPPAPEGHGPGKATEWRRFVNSRLPEKRLALAAGLGAIGRNCLLLLPRPGSAIVLGILLVPPSFRLEPAGEPSLGSPGEPELCADCADCGLCVAACPTGALRGDGSLDRELCLQHWSSVPGPLPPAVEAAWGDRLYGCDACQEACPRFRPEALASCSRGQLGPGLPAAFLAGASDETLHRCLKGSALGMGWISLDALRRNARHLTASRLRPTIV